MIEQSFDIFVKFKYNNSIHCSTRYIPFSETQDITLVVYISWTSRKIFESQIIKDRLLQIQEFQAQLSHHLGDAIERKSIDLRLNSSLENLKLKRGNSVW